MVLSFVVSLSIYTVLLLLFCYYAPCVTYYFIRHRKYVNPETCSWNITRSASFTGSKIGGKQAICDHVNGGEKLDRASEALFLIDLARHS